MATVKELQEQEKQRFLKNNAHPQVTPLHGQVLPDAGEAFIKAPGMIAEAGMVSSDYIVESGGQTFGETTILLDNEDTLERLGNAGKAFEGKNFKAMKPEEQASVLNDFVWFMNQPNAVGPYFPAVRALESEKSGIEAEAMGRVLAGVWNDIADVRNDQSAMNRAVWDARPQGAALQRDQVTQVLTTNDDADLDVLLIKQQAAINVIGQSVADQIREQVNHQYSLAKNASPQDIEQVVTNRLLSAAADASMTAEEKTRVTQIDQEVDQLWHDKHNGPNRDRDFADAVRNGRPDCSEYASFSAVAMEKAGIRNMRVMGHVMQEGSDYVGCHAYNAIVEERGGVQYVVGVFEGTATSDPYRQVMNNNGRGITLSDFQNGQTLVTYNDQAGWQTYGTGKTELVEFEYQGEDKSYLSLKGRRSDIARNDTALMAETKAEWTRSQTPEMLAERVFDLCEQYGEQATSNLHVELAMENIDPRLASALEVMARRPEGISFEEYQNTSDYKQLEGLLSNDGYSLDQAFTFQHIDDYEDAWLDVELSEQLHRVINKNPEALEEHYADKPWLREVVDLLEGRPDYTDSLIHRLTDATPEDLDAYERVQSLIRHKDISLDDIKDLSRPEPDVQSGSSLEVQLGR